MPEENQGGQNGQNNTPTVPKADFDRLQAQVAEGNRTLENLRSELTSPEYIEYRASKNRPPAPATNNGQPVTLGNMSLEQLQQMMVQSVGATVQTVLKPILERIDNLDAQQELDIVMRKYEDFEDVRDQVANILNTAKNELTIEQAYLMAKAQQPAGEENQQQAPAAGQKGAPAGRPAPQGNERPSSNVPVEGDTIKKYKDANDAGQAAWNEVAARHGLQGDKI